MSVLLAGLIVLYLLYAGVLMHVCVDHGPWRQMPVNRQWIAFIANMGFCMIWPITMLLYFGIIKRQK